MDSRRPPRPAHRRGKPSSGSRQDQRHLQLLKRAVRSLGSGVIDRRTCLGKTLVHWRAELVRDLGGAESISAQQAALIELAVSSKLLLDTVDAWLLMQGSLVNARKRALIPAVRERQQLADSLARLLGQLGLERRGRRPMDLDAYLAHQYPDASAPRVARSPAIGEADGPAPAPADLGAAPEAAP